ncbi:unnamed protein product [Psylliodes chrysocephalus]|uniref:UPF3 domain-containing protein n=1 Tax=Psylliodes chrysocephalus TaxID=3402493 RepID=A0A9P0D1Y2_9CUCU|nr:unnamed protein product [Psylliodes chrysocephala]
MALPEAEKKADKKEKPSTKVIIRRLPPTIDQETFLKQVSPIPDYDYIYTVSGDFSLGENAFSRVYVNFVKHEDVYNFKERFDNYVFLDAKGNEYPCVVEFASFQKIPKKRGKNRMDPKAGSIESDPYYSDFLDILKKPQELDEKPEYTLQLTTSTENKNDLTTPLLEYIKNKRAQRMKIRELRREERKRREFDKKRDYDDRKKISEEKSPTKKSHPKLETVKSEKSEEGEEKIEKEERYYEKSYYKNKDRRYEDRRFEERRKEPKPRFPRKEYPDYKTDNPKEKKYEFKKEFEPKTYPKKVKKYSEKREERKMEAQKAEQKKIDEAKADEKKAEDSSSKHNEDLDKLPQIHENSFKEDLEKLKTDENSPRDIEKVDKDSKHKERDSESQNQRRIRNKDRPTIAIYRPGMLSKRKQTGEGDSNENKEKSEEK